MLSERDLIQLEKRGIKPEEIYQQVDYFKSGFPWMQLDRSAILGDGVIRLSADELSHYQEAFDQQKSGLSIVKLVPASGAATRMFKSLFEHLSEGKANKESAVFFERLSEFAFAEELMALLPVDSNDEEVLKGLLTAAGLEYGTLPKGLLAFHRYADQVRTPLEEHLVEAAEYASDGRTARLHFTVSPEHRGRFEQLVAKVVPPLEHQYAISFEISFSEQKPATDTVAVEPDNSLFRESDGSLLFRPAGHGALLENLNDLSADIIFIKNIDNVVPDALKPSTIMYKKALGGLLLWILGEIKRWHGLLGQHPNDPETIAGAVAFMKAYLGFVPALDFNNLNEQGKAFDLRAIFARPTRICGVVKNTGEPGGGPFWCQDALGNSTLQLVESAQVDLQHEGQKSIFTGSTHFNPVDLVCATKDLEGKPYDLLAFRDMSTGFITEKTKDGRALKAQELPGLWNGAMAKWNTVFVEVPLETFNPVKSVTDLLRPAHQS
jgi:hypothetical protein